MADSKNAPVVKLAKWREAFARGMQNVFDVIVAPKSDNARTVLIETERFDAEAFWHVFVYGVKQILNDAGSQHETVSDKLAAAEAKLTTLYDGTFGTRTSGRTVDSVAFTFAREMLRAHLNKRGAKIPAAGDAGPAKRWPNMSRMEADCTANKVSAERLMAAATVKAESVLAAEKEAAGFDLDLE